MMSGPFGSLAGVSVGTADGPIGSRVEGDLHFGPGEAIGHKPLTIQVVPRQPGSPLSIRLSRIASRRRDRAFYLPKNWASLFQLVSVFGSIPTR
jgi:hypothetical protein